MVYAKNFVELIIFIISLFKVYFTITFHNYKKLVKFNLAIKLDTNSVTNNLDLTMVLSLYRVFTAEKR